MPTAAAKLEAAIVTKDELMELADLEKKFAEAKRKVSSLEKDLEAARISLAEKVLAVKSKDELKKMPPDRVEKLQAKRLETGHWKPERGAPEFSFVKTSQGSYPAWQQLFIAELGETAAARIKADTAVSYSYCVEVSL